MASVVREQEMRSQLEAKPAEERGYRDLTGEWWKLESRVENEVDVREESHVCALEVEKERSSRIVSFSTSRNTCIEANRTVQNTNYLQTESKSLSVHNAENEKCLPQEINAFHKAEIVSRIQKENDDRKLALETMRNIKAKNRFKAALKKSRIEKQYFATMTMLEKAEKQRNQENAQEVSQVPPDRKTMCAPVDRLIKMDKQERLEKGFEKVLPKAKEHAIEDLEGYKDEVEERFSTKEMQPKVSLESSCDSRFNGEKDLFDFDSLLRPDSFEERYYATRESSTDDLFSRTVRPALDLLNMAYIESLSPDQPPPLSSSPISSVASIRKDFGVQVDDTMFPVSIGVQVNLLLPKERIDNSISETFVNEVDQWNRLVSVGIQTDYIIMIDPSTLFPPSVSNDHPMPSKQGASMFPSLFISQNESERSSSASSKVDSSEYDTALSVSKETESETDKIRQRIERNLENKHKKYFPPICLGPNSSPESSERLRRLQKDTDSASMRETASLSKLPVRAIPLSEPIRDRFAPSGSFLSGGTAKVITEENSATAEPHSSFDYIQSLNDIRKHIHSQLNNEDFSPLASKQKAPRDRSHVKNVSSSITEAITQPKALSRENDVGRSRYFPAHPSNISETRSSAPVHSSSLVENSSNQSCLDIRKEELPNISMLTNLSEIEISHTSALEDDKEKSSMVIPSTTDDNTVPDASSTPSGSTHTRRTISTENLKRISNIIQKQLQDQHPSLESASFEHRDNSDDSRTPRVCWLRNGQPFIYHELSTIQEGDSALADITVISIDDMISESSSFRLLLDQIQQKEELDSTPTSLISEVSDVSHLLETVKLTSESPSITNSSGAENCNVVEEAVPDSHSSSRLMGNSKKTTMSPLCLSPTLTSEETVIPSSSSDSCLKKRSDVLSQGSSTTSYARSLTVPSDSFSSNERSPIAVETLTPAHQVSPKPLDQKSESEENASRNDVSDSIHPPTSSEAQASSYSNEYHRIIDALISNYSLSPPPLHPMASQDRNRILLVQPSVCNEKRRQISDLSQISLDFNQGDLILLTSNSSSSSPSTKSSSLPELTPSTLTKKTSNYGKLVSQPPTSLPQSPVPSLGQESKSSSQSTQGSFKPLSLVISTSNGSNNISEGPPDSNMLSIPASPQQPYDITEEGRTPTFSSQYHIPTSFSPLSYVANTGSDSPNSETLQPQSMIAPKSTSSEDVIADSQTPIDQGASHQSAAEHLSSQHFQVPLLSTTGSGSRFEPLTLQGFSSTDQFYGTQQKVDFKSDSSETLTPPIRPSGAGQSSNPNVPFMPMSSSGSFQPLILLDTPSSSTSSPIDVVVGKTSSSSLSNASESYKPLHHKAVTKERMHSDINLMRKLCAKNLAMQDSNSSSDESLSRMFTKSRIAYHSTPTSTPTKKAVDNLPQEIPEVDKKEDEEETMLTKSKSIQSFSSIEHTRYVRTSNVAGKLVTHETSESRTTYVETFVKTGLVSVVVQSDSDEHIPSIDTKMSESMASFLQHEESISASPDEHVSLLSEDYLAPPTESQDLNEKSPKTPKTSSISIEGTASYASATSNQFSTPSYTPADFAYATSSGSSTNRIPPWTSSEYKKRTQRLWNNLEEVKARQQVELKKKTMAQNKEKVKELQQKLRKRKKPHTPKKK